MENKKKIKIWKRRFCAISFVLFAAQFSDEVLSFSGSLKFLEKSSIKVYW